MTDQSDQVEPLLINDPKTYDYVFDGHAGAGPSSSERWLHCTASLQASREFLETLTPNQQVEFARSNMAARQGTTAHAAAEAEAKLLLGKITEQELKGTLTELSIEPDTADEAYSEVMADYITEYTDLVKTYIDSHGPENVLIEQRVGAPISLTEGQTHTIHGSGDCIVLPTEDEPELVAMDLKYGMGIDVEVDENSQARIYGLAALDMVDASSIERVRYYIVQPRLGGIKEWSESVNDLLAWRDEVLAPALGKALAGAEGGATFEPSEVACQWCPARGTCPALAEQRVKDAAGLFDTVVEAEYADGPGSFPETSSLSDARLGELLNQINGLVNIQKDLKAEAQRRMYRGGQVPGFKLVSYTPPRRWKTGSEDVLDDVDEVWKKSLITPKQALTVLAKGNEDRLAEVEDLVEEPDKKPVIAPEGDRRKEWTGTPPEQMFDDESET